jgi:hypothetical protein
MSQNTDLHVSVAGHDALRLFGEELRNADAALAALGIHSTAPDGRLRRLAERIELLAELRVAARPEAA